MQRNGSAIIGRIFKEDNKNKFKADDLIFKYEYKINGLEKYNDGDIIITKFIDFVDGIIYLKIVEMLGSSDDATLEPELIAYKFDLKTKFSDLSIKEIEKVKNQNISGRKDLSQRLIYTIDGEESKDLDDAVDILKLENGNYRLGVHIADVSHYVKQGTSLDEEAYERGTSVYLINTVFPMLPKELSNDLCSLNPNTKKLTMTCDMIINPKGEVIDTKIYESEIISKHRLTYVEVDDFYSEKISILRTKELSESLIEAKNLASILRNKKINHGMIDFSLAESKISLDDEGQVKEIYNKFQTLSERVIEDLMVVTNESVAKKLTSKKLPASFRVHPSPKKENLDNFINLSKSLGVTFLKNSSNIESEDFMNLLNENSQNKGIDILKRYMIQTMEKAFYKTEDLGHYALGVKNYLHFTSPIRRYPDLIVHRLIKKYFLDSNAEKNRKNCADDVSKLEIMNKHASEKERNAVQAERKLQDIKKARFMKKMIGEKLQGQIVSVLRFGFFVEFENLTQGLVTLESLKDDEYFYDESKFAIFGKQNKKTFKLGEVVNVKIISVDVVRGLIDLEAS